MRFLTRLAACIDSLNAWMGRGVAWVTTFLVVVVFLDVIMRYAFNTSFVFTQELEWHLFGFIFLMGAGYTLLHEGHVRVDIVYQRLDRKAQAWVDLVGCLVFLFPGAIMVIATAMPFVTNSFSVLEGSPDPGGIPFRFIIKSCIPIGFVLFGLQGISLFVKSLRTVMGLDQAGEGAN